MTPYRVKRLRLNQSIRCDSERDFLSESEHRLILWRVSDSEFRVQRVCPPGEMRPSTMSESEWADRNKVVGFFTDQVRDYQLYSSDEPMPHPEYTTPPGVMDGAQVKVKK